MPTSPHRRVQRDSSASRLLLWVQRASEAPDGQTTTYPGTMRTPFSASRATSSARSPPAEAGGVDWAPVATRLLPLAVRAAHGGASSSAVEQVRDLESLQIAFPRKTIHNPLYIHISVFSQARKYGQKNIFYRKRIHNAMNLA